MNNHNRIETAEKEFNSIHKKGDRVYVDDASATVIAQDLAALKRVT